MGKKSPSVIYVTCSPEQHAAALAKADQLDISLRALVMRAIEAYEVPPSESARIERLEARIETLEGLVRQLAESVVYSDPGL